MKIAPGVSALITGAGSGIGRALALDFAQKGASISVVDFVEKNGLETVEMVKLEHQKLGLKPAVIFIKCDVTKSADVKAAFDDHKANFQTLDICINSAGIAEVGEVLTDEISSWRAVLDVNLNGVIECTSRAVKLMREGGKAGVIVNIASAAGLAPSPFPVYSASKGGVILFSRSLAHLRSEEIRVNVLCPEFVATHMTTVVAKEIIESVGGFIPMEKIIEGTLKMVEDDENKEGDCLYISKVNGFVYISN